ncbi:MAG TPA: hypothetical protein GX511_05670, partial [Firmicutes bacterium]|nr:hypothetical protein [Bacillota bacterium]
NWVEVFTSSDGGASWQLAVSTDPQQQKPDRLPLGGLKTGIGALDAKTAWVTGFDYGDQIWLYRTPDAGKTWQRQAVTAPAGYHTEGGAVETRPPVFFGQDGFLPVLFHQEGQPTIFYVTHDDGATWRPTAPVKSAGNSSFVWSFIDSRHGFATDGKKIYATEDGARSWTAITMNRELTNVSQLAFVSTKAGWALADGTLWATQDGGRTWTMLTH